MIVLEKESFSIKITGNIKNKDDLDLIVDSVNSLKNSYEIKIYLIDSISIISEVFMFLKRHQEEYKSLSIYVKDNGLLKFINDDLCNSKILRCKRLGGF